MYSTISFIQIGKVPLWPNTGNAAFSWSFIGNYEYEHNWLSSYFDNQHIYNVVHFGQADNVDYGYLVDDGSSLWLQRPALCIRKLHMEIVPCEYRHKEE